VRRDGSSSLNDWRSESEAIIMRSEELGDHEAGSSDPSRSSHFI
jgi:hypothetical protein